MEGLLLEGSGLERGFGGGEIEGQGVWKWERMW